MSLKKVANLMGRGLSPLIPAVSNIGSGAIVLMMLLTVADVTGRRVFNQPLLGAYELNEFMLVIVVFFSIVQCELLRGHIAIELVVSRLSQRAQDAIDSAIYIFLLVTFCLLTWRLWLYATEIWQDNVVSGVLEVPVFPFIFLESLCCALLSLVILIRLLLFLSEALRK